MWRSFALNGFEDCVEGSARHRHEISAIIHLSPVYRPRQLA
jgi:hypothetical protein